MGRLAGGASCLKGNRPRAGRTHTTKHILKQSSSRAQKPIDLPPPKLRGEGGHGLTRMQDSPSLVLCPRGSFCFSYFLFSLVSFPISIAVSSSSVSVREQGSRLT